MYASAAGHVDVARKAGGYGNAVFLKHVEKPKKRLQLTFDDGPLDEVKAQGGSTAALDKILGELKTRGVKGAFFVLGQEVAVRPTAVQAIVQAGHIVGNHSYTHLGDKGETERLLATEEGKKTVLDEFQKTHDVVAKYVDMRHWRAPRLERGSPVSGSSSRPAPSSSTTFPTRTSTQTAWTASARRTRKRC